MASAKNPLRRDAPATISIICGVCIIHCPHSWRRIECFSEDTIWMTESVIELKAAQHDNLTGTQLMWVHGPFCG
jgi:hypothetical protein